MRRKRLHHAADTMCQMFCGWRLIGSKANLIKLGSGTLEINAIDGTCVFESEAIKQLTIAKEIQAWLQQDLTANKIPIDSLTGAHLAINLSVSEVPWNHDIKEIFYAHGGAVRTEKMNRCVMECKSNISTRETVYRSKLISIQEWPIGWPPGDFEIQGDN